mmetsp:Transcript_50141/g.167527  ORF Transcript_50141/g.167527 Transcript_50141/m.167527 type:complete len:217 (-) Transcript_50141:105-755(-)
MFRGERHRILRTPLRVAGRGAAPTPVHAGLGVGVRRGATLQRSRGAGFRRRGREREGLPSVDARRCCCRGAVVASHTPPRARSALHRAHLRHPEERKDCVPRDHPRRKGGGAAGARPQGEGVRAAEEELLADRQLRLWHHGAHRPRAQVQPEHWHLWHGLLRRDEAGGRWSRCEAARQAQQDWLPAQVHQGGDAEVVCRQVRGHPHQLSRPGQTSL